ncbi:MAG: LysR substrate-binding domain-containing protein [Armatimonas sp.]
MELRHLRYFVAVAEEMNVRRAAVRLCMEQPSLSRQIQQLEREMGVALFRRVKRHIELTTAGYVFLEETRRTLAQVEQSVDLARQVSRREQQSINVSTCFALTRYSHAFDSTFAQVIKTFRERHVGIGLTLSELDSVAQEKALQEGASDIGFSLEPKERDGLVAHRLLWEPFVLALPKDHPLAGEAEISLEALHQEVLFLFPEHASPAFYQEILAASEKAGLRYRSVQTAESLQKALWLVGAGLGVTFVGQSIAEMRPPNVALCPIRDFASGLGFAAIWRADNRHPFLADFVQLAQERFEFVKAKQR